MKCRNCKHLYKNWCVHKLDSPDPDLDRECKDYEQATRGDRIRAMSDEALAIALVKYEATEKRLTRFGGHKHIFYGPNGEICGSKLEAVAMWAEWLRQPAKEN